MNTGIHIKKVLMFYSADFQFWKVLGGVVAIVLSILIKVLFPAIGLIILVLLDVRFGIKKFIKNKKKEGVVLKSEHTYRNVKSEGLRRTISKITDYVIFIIAFMTLEVIMTSMGVNVSYENFSLSTFVVLLLCLVEMKSIDEKFEELYKISILTSVLDFVFRRKSVDKIVSEKYKDEKQ